MPGPLTSGDESALMSQYEMLPSHPLISRDGGVSVCVAPGRDLWFFNDSEVVTGGSVQLVPGSTAAVSEFSPGQTPILTELRTPADPWAESPVSEGPATSPQVPEQFLANPTDLDCGSGGADRQSRWPNGAAVVPNSNLVLISYIDVCIVKGQSLNITVHRSGFVLYNWQTNSLASRYTTIIGTAATVLPSPAVVGGPMFTATGLWWTAHHCVSWVGFCNDGTDHCLPTQANHAAVYFIHSPLNEADWSNPSTFSYETSSGQLVPFTLQTATQAASDPELLGTVIPGACPALGPQVGQYGDDGLIAVVATSLFGGGYQVFQSASDNPATGPWTMITDAMAGSRDSLPDCSGGVNGFCHALSSHPELSISGGQLSGFIGVTYFDPERDAGLGHLVFARLPVPVS